jgi:FixJ family two-component response regulator
MIAAQAAEVPVISIIDDNQAVRDAMVDVITALGFRAQAFESAEYFLQSSHPDSTSCLITDVRMPGMTGPELHNRLVASGKSIPTIMMTAFATEADRVQAKQAGVICYLEKPVDDKVLAICIRLALAARSNEEAI